MSSELQEYISCGISSAEELAALIDSSAERPSPRDDSLILGTALSCGQHLWQSEVVRNALHRNAALSGNLGIVFELLTCQCFTPENERRLLGLLSDKQLCLVGLDNVFRLLVDLHRRGVLDATRILLPRLHWYSGSNMWKAAIMTLRVCAPAAFGRRRVRSLAFRTSASCGALFGVVRAEFQGNVKGFRSAIKTVSNLADRHHKDVVLNFSWISKYDGPELARKVLSEMVSLGDFRDTEFLAPFMSGAPEDQSNILTLSRLAGAPNRDAAAWAQIFLKASGER